MRANAFGFYAINGESVVDFKEDSKKESVCEFLEKIREKNPEKTMVIILDNFRSHRGQERREEKRRSWNGSGSSTTSLLSRSEPDRRDLESYKEKTLPIQTLDELKKVILKSFYELTQRISFAEKWIEKFLNFG